MTYGGTDYQELHDRLELTPDGLPAREVGSWTLNKLALIAYYLPPFAELCASKARGWYFVDAFAGNGANAAPGFPLAKGSALLGITQQPRATKALLIEKEHDSAAILTDRVARHGGFADVFEGNANEILPAKLELLDNRHLPAFCVLDPAGLELEWGTVEACARHRAHGSPYELLIYFSTPGAARSAGVRAEGYAEMNARRLSKVFGNESWKEVAALQQQLVLAPKEAGKRYLALYESQLRNLGYTTVLDRPSLREDGNLVYHLVFASGNDAGRKIMSDALSRAYAGQMPLL